MPTDFNPEPGKPETLEPGVVRVLAPNPSAMTFRGTNSYVLGDQNLCIIDPGPDDPAHLQALMDAIGGRHVAQIIVTHAHMDHSPLAHRLSQRVEAPVLAFGDALAGQSDIMRRLAAQGLTGGGEGVDTNFQPDRIVVDLESVTGSDSQLTILHTPGHMGNHIALEWNDILFSGDHVMGWSTSLVSPPDGDLTAFMQSCARLLTRPSRIYHPGHGAPVSDPIGRVQDLIAHRKSRENQILNALSATPIDIPTLTRQVYTDVVNALMPVAERNVFAHLIDLTSRNQIQALPDLGFRSKYSLGPRSE